MDNAAAGTVAPPESSRKIYFVEKNCPADNTPGIAAKRMPAWRLLACVCLSATATVTMPAAETQSTTRPNAPPPASNTGEALRNEADTRTLEAILDDQATLLDALQTDPELKRLPEAEKERRVLDLTRRYEALLERRPRDGAVMILYGKFLRLVDARAEANHWFEKADALLPGMSVIKHQMGVYAAEEGNYVRALDLLETTVSLEPKAAVYHYHLGEFLATYRPHLVREKLLKREDCDARMQAAFAHAVELNPNEPGYHWRYAQSFFDCEKPEWPRALAAWKRLAAIARTPLEREAISLYQARVLIALGQRAEAKLLIDAGKAPQLEKTRGELRELLRPKVAPLPIAPTTAPAPESGKLSPIP
jgi:tetratricopeptide (TPR) repeat protein